jgi:flagellar secretion chaperone FliS
MVGFNNYRKTDIITADPKKLVILCYEAVVYNLKTAKEKYIAKDYEAKGKAIQNALDIIGELRGVLDFEKGGEIAKNLDSLYGFWARHILNADRKRDTKALDDVIVMLEEIKSALEEAYFGRHEPQEISAASSTSPVYSTEEVVNLQSIGYPR